MDIRLRIDAFRSIDIHIYKTLTCVAEFSLRAFLRTLMAPEAIPKEWVQTWNLFDERKSGSVSQTDLKHILRSLGRRYTEGEFREMLSDLPEKVTYEVFLSLMQQPYTGPTEEDLVTALRAFDANDSGSLLLSELITLLTSLGEKMPEAEVSQLLSEVVVDEDGRVSIDELSRFLCSPVPNVTPDILELQRQLEQTPS